MPPIFNDEIPTIMLTPLETEAATEMSDLADLLQLQISEATRSGFLTNGKAVRETLTRIGQCQMVLFRRPTQIANSKAQNDQTGSVA